MTKRFGEGLEARRSRRRGRPPCPSPASSQQHQRRCCGRGAGRRGPASPRGARDRAAPSHRPRRRAWRRRSRERRAQKVGPRDRCRASMRQEVSAWRRIGLRASRPQASSMRAQSGRRARNLATVRSSGLHRRRAWNDDGVPRGVEGQARPPRWRGDRATPVAQHRGEFLRLRGTGLVMGAAVSPQQRPRPGRGRATPGRTSAGPPSVVSAAARVRAPVVSVEATGNPWDRGPHRDRGSIGRRAGGFPRERGGHRWRSSRRQQGVDELADVQPAGDRAQTPCEQPADRAPARYEAESLRARSVGPGRTTSDEALGPRCRVRRGARPRRRRGGRGWRRDGQARDGPARRPDRDDR